MWLTDPKLGDPLQYQRGDDCPDPILQTEPKSVLGLNQGIEQKPYSIAQFGARTSILSGQVQGIPG